MTNVDRHIACLATLQSQGDKSVVWLVRESPTVFGKLRYPLNLPTIIDRHFVVFIRMEILLSFICWTLLGYWDNYKKSHELASRATDSAFESPSVFFIHAHDALLKSKRFIEDASLVKKYPNHDHGMGKLEGAQNGASLGLYWFINYSLVHLVNLCVCTWQKNR